MEIVKVMSVVQLANYATKFSSFITQQKKIGPVKS